MNDVRKVMRFNAMRPLWLVGLLAAIGVPTEMTEARESVPSEGHLHPATGHPPADSPPDRRPLEPDETFVNPVTGEEGTICALPWERADGSLVGVITATAGAQVAGEHAHPTLRERFEVVSGELHVRLNGSTRILHAGEVEEIAPGVWHDWWNSSRVPAVVRMQVSPGERFLQMLETLFGLARDGYTDAHGMPNLFQLAMLDHAFHDVVVFRHPSVAVQTALFTALRPIARALGYRPTYPRYSRTVLAPRNKGPLPAQAVLYRQSESPIYAPTGCAASDRDAETP